jgi:hypothetical protein
MNFKIIEKDDCIGEYKVYIYILENNVTEGLCDILGEVGELKIFNKFPRPYFRILGSFFLLKSIIGSNEIEVTYYDYALMRKKEEIESSLSKFNFASIMIAK